MTKCSGGENGTEDMVALETFSISCRPHYHETLAYGKSEGDTGIVCYEGRDLNFFHVVTHSFRSSVSYFILLFAIQIFG